MPMSPGTYLQKRRKAAGLSIAAVAIHVAPNSRDLDRTIDALGRLEADELHPGDAFLVQLLRTAFAFDSYVYQQLVDLRLTDPGSMLPRPQVCDRCACSWHDPCQHADGEACHWAADNLCSACAGGPDEGEHAPIAANDRAGRGSSGMKRGGHGKPDLAAARAWQRPKRKLAP